MTAPRLTAERALLITAAAVSTAGFAVVHGVWRPWIVIALIVVSLRFQVPTVSRGVARLLGLARVAAIIVAVLFSYYAGLLGLISDRASSAGVRIVGDLLVALLGVSLLVRSEWRPARVQMPLILALLVLVALQPNGQASLWFAMGGGTALWGWAVLASGPRRPLAAAVFGLLALPIVAGTIDFLPWASVRAMGIVGPSLAGAATGLSSRTVLGGITDLAVSDRIVLRAWMRQPRLLRAWVYDSFDGRAWTSSRASRMAEAGPMSPGALAAPGGVLIQIPGWLGLGLQNPESGAPLLPDVAGELRLVPPARVSDVTRHDLAAATIVFSASSEVWPLVAPAGTVALRVEPAAVRSGPLGSLVVDGAPCLYGILYRLGGTGNGDPPTGLEPPELRLPPSLDPRVRHLAERLARGVATPQARLRRTVEYLRAAYRYTLHVGRFRTKDPLAEFLFEKRAGYCEYFATAAVMLLRAQGVPARYVKGFSIGAHNDAGDHYVVRERDAHAWVEAWMPGEGWMEADPTPPGDFERAHPAQGHQGLLARVEALRARMSMGVARLRQWSWASAREHLVDLAARGGLWLRAHPLAWLAVLLLALINPVRRWWQRRRLSRSGISRRRLPAGLTRLARLLERRWTRAGWPRPPSRGLAEHLEAIPAQALAPEERAALATGIDLYYAAVYGDRPASAEQVAAVSARLRDGATDPGGRGA